MAAAFTTLCCLGFTAALSLASAVGATFFNEDATLKPLLLVTIILTLAGSALTYPRHRHPLPLILAALAGALGLPSPVEYGFGTSRVSTRTPPRPTKILRAAETAK